MRFAWLRFVVVWLMFIATAAQSSSLTNIHTVFLIVMENVSWSDLVGNANAPYINNVLLPQSSYASNMFIIPGTFGSLPQYLWLESGTNWGVTNSSSEPSVYHFATTNHLVVQLENTGIPWKSYQEGVNGKTCPTTSSGVYVAWHNPFVYFDDIYLSATNCTNHIRPYTEFERDLTNNTVARYNFITPNLCHDMHGSTDCPSGSRIRFGDDWLSTEIPRILNSQAYQNNGAIIITWDEGTANVAGPYGTIVLSSWAKGGGYAISNRLDHTATFRTLQEIFQVPLLYAAQTGPDLSDLFKPTLELSAPFFTNQTFTFMADGLMPGKTNYFQFTTNFWGVNPVTWQTLLSNVISTNRFLFVDTNAANFPQRFYRVLESH